MVTNVFEYIEETNPIEVRELLIAAHHFLQETLPLHAKCSIKWKIPFYTLNRSFCYLNRHKDHITIGFPQGFRLTQIPEILLGERDRLKQIRYLEIRSLEDLYSEITNQILQEAIFVDEMLGNAKSGSKSLQRRRTT